MPSTDEPGQNGPNASEATPPHEPALASLLAQLLKDAETLVLQELALFRAELGENTSRLVAGVLIILTGLAVALIGGLALVAAVIQLVAFVLPLWGACVVVGVAISGVGAALMLYGRRLVARASFVPRQTWRSLREAGDWLGEELT